MLALLTLSCSLRLGSRVRRQARRGDGVSEVMWGLHLRQEAGVFCICLQQRGSFGARHRVPDAASAAPEDGGIGARPGAQRRSGGPSGIPEPPVAPSAELRNRYKPIAANTNATTPAMVLAVVLASSTPIVRSTSARTTRAMTTVKDTGRRNVAIVSTAKTIAQLIRYSATLFVTAAAGIASQLCSRPSSRIARLNQKPAKSPKMHATIVWPKAAAQIVEIASPSPVAAKITGMITPPAADGT